jgi:CheY-like chemotaxis protein
MAAAFVEGLSVSTLAYQRCHLAYQRCLSARVLRERIEERRGDVEHGAKGAFAMHDDQDKILAAGCEDYMAKPISIGPFVAMVRKYLNIA